MLDTLKHFLLKLVSPAKLPLAAVSSIVVATCLVVINSGSESLENAIIQNRSDPIMRYIGLLAEYSVPIVLLAIVLVIGVGTLIWVFFRFVNAIERERRRH